jgi:hypothetical protein
MLFAKNRFAVEGTSFFECAKGTAPVQIVEER